MKTTKKRPRDFVVGIRLNSAERAALLKAAQADGMNLSAWMRFRSMQAVWNWKHDQRKGRI